MFGLEILKNRLKDAPKTSGVYLFKNKKDIPIYIGKAINIKRRLSNYGNLPKLPRRLQKMVSQTVNIDFELTESERNALLLEALLIKKFSPRYNIRLKDDKSFPLIKITNGDFPRLTRFRNDFSNEDKVFGPFTSALKTDRVIKILQKSFKLRSCNDLEFKNRNKLSFSKTYNEGKKPLLFNNDLTIGMSHPKSSSNDAFYKNSSFDELVFIHYGNGLLKTFMGNVEFCEGDYIVIPRGIIYQFEFSSRKNKIFYIESNSPINFPKKYLSKKGLLISLSKLRCIEI